jgi:hypothetical protein
MLELPLFAVLLAPAIVYALACSLRDYIRIKRNRDEDWF